MPYSVLDQKNIILCQHVSTQKKTSLQFYLLHKLLLILLLIIQLNEVECLVICEEISGQIIETKLNGWFEIKFTFKLSKLKAWEILLKHVRGKSNLKFLFWCYSSLLSNYLLMWSVLINIYWPHSYRALELFLNIFATFCRGSNPPLRMSATTTHLQLLIRFSYKVWVSGHDRPR